MESSTVQDLKARWAKLLEEQPKTRIRNAAETLGVSEVELLATKVGKGVTRLRPEFANILGEIEKLGKVMALTRNGDVVHERKGVYLNPSLDNPHVGLFVGADIDLRIFLSCWDSAFAVTEMTGDKPRRSLQFFATDGEAVHKIYLVPQSDVEVYEALTAKYKSEDQSPQQAVEPWPAADPEKPDAEINAAEFQEKWRNLKDTHHFFGMLKKYQVTRTQALRLAPEGNYAVPVDPKAVRKTLDLAAERDVEIMVFVGNKGMIQIHTGPVKKLMEYGEWYNVLDPDFNLHLRESAVEQCLVVRKPTEDGMVTALECFDKEGVQIAQFFGKRKPGIPELETWSALVAVVEHEYSTTPV